MQHIDKDGLVIADKGKDQLLIQVNDFSGNSYKVAMPVSKVRTLFLAYIAQTMQMTEPPLSSSPGDKSQ